MTDKQPPEVGRPWHERARTKWDVRYTGHDIVLMSRHVDESGKDHSGEPVPWRDVAVFTKWSDAWSVLRKLEDDDAR